MPRKYTIDPDKSPGRPQSEVGKLAAREGITRHAAWWRLNRSTRKPRGRPRKESPPKEESKTIKEIKRPLAWIAEALRARNRS